MSRIALTRLVVASNRSSRWRLGGIVAGVGVGVALFLLLFGAAQGFPERSLRSTWTNLIGQGQSFTPANSQLAKNQVVASSQLDHYRGELIGVVTVASEPGATVKLPGSGHIPAAGEYVASPALIALMAASPSAELADRYGTRVGELTSDALEGPDSLVVVKGATTQALLTPGLAAQPVVVEKFSGYDYSSRAYRIVALIGALAVLMPVLLLIAIVTDLGAAQRAERFATLRLVGATPRQLARIAALETGITTFLGALAGVGLYLAVIPAAAQLKVGSSRFYPHDLLVSPGIAIAVMVATVVGATLVAWQRTWRAKIGPLGANRERMERAPQAWALLPLLAGIALQGGCVWFVARGGDRAAMGIFVIGGFVLTTLGLLWAGPLLTSWVTKMAVRMARTPAQVIGLSRIARHPRAAFRAVAGLVVAAFAVTVFAVGITAAAGVRYTSDGKDRLPASTLFASFSAVPTPGELAAIHQLQSLPGVTGTVIGYSYQGTHLVFPAADASSLGLEVPTDTRFVSVTGAFLADSSADPQPIVVTDPNELQPQLAFVLTAGGAGSIERARTALVTSGVPLSFYPITRSDNMASAAAAPENQFAAMAYIGILIAVALSAVSLAVSTLAAVMSRQRVLRLLQLVGMSQRTLGRVIGYETVIPVVTVFLVSIGLGGFTAWCIISAISRRTIGWPQPSYYAVLGLCVALLVGAITVAVKAARAITANASTRYE